MDEPQPALLATSHLRNEELQFSPPDSPPTNTAKHVYRYHDRIWRRRRRYASSPPPANRFPGPQADERKTAIAGRVGLTAFKRYKAGAGGAAAGALGKQFYKGGFENRMNRREAALILQMR